MEASSAEPRGQCVTPGSVADLTVWLQGHGIDTSTWGEGQAKTVDSLLKEIEQEVCARTARFASRGGASRG